MSAEAVWVVKAGTSTVVGPNGPREPWLAQLAQAAALLAAQGKRLVVVSSGAVGCGRWRLGLKGKPKGIPEKQAAAAVGQGILMHHYEQALSKQGMVSAQLLLTAADLRDRTRYVNASHALRVLLSQPGVVPIVNENDSVAVDEIKVGDNDTLSAYVAALVGAELLVLLSDVDGLYEADPRKDPQAKRLEEIASITPAIEALAGGAGSEGGTGGMVTKLAAARIATSCGIPMRLMQGEDPLALVAVARGESRGTRFAPQANPLAGRKRWLAFGGRVEGKIHLDAGAAKAIAQGGKSLLPAGIRRVEGRFDAGALVALLTPEGQELGRGLVSYGAEELGRIRGLRSAELEEALGMKAPYEEAVHRDHLVTTTPEAKP